MDGKIRHDGLRHLNLTLLTGIQGIPARILRIQLVGFMTSVKEELALYIPRQILFYRTLRTDPVGLMPSCINRGLVESTLLTKISETSGQP